MIEIIKNKNNEKISVLIEFPRVRDCSKLAFICHGITSYKEFHVIRIIAASLLDNNYTVVSFDCRNSLGESFSQPRCATLSDFYEDLTDVINWAKSQNFYTSTYVLAGHSLGGAAALNYAINHPQEVSKLIAVSAVISGKLLDKAYQDNLPQFYEQLKNETIIRQLDKRICHLNYDFIKDALQYDFIQQAEDIKCPILQITGAQDPSSTTISNQLLYNVLLTPKELHILSNCGHTYDTPKNQRELSIKIKKFL